MHVFLLSMFLLELADYVGRIVLRNEYKIGCYTLDSPHFSGQLPVEV